jgi:Flp pilus assembly pilin Flp
MKKLIGRMAQRMHDREDGQGLAEYALILAFIAAVCVAALGALGQAIAGSSGFSMF